MSDSERVLTLPARATYRPPVGIGEALAAFRTTGSEADRGRLAVAIRDRLTRAARYAGVRELDVEDVVQSRVLAVLSALSRGPVPDSPEAYVWRAGLNAAKDWHRRQAAGVRGRTHGVDPEDLDRLGTAPDEVDGKETAEDLRRVVDEALDDPRMPEAHRAVIDAHYLRGEDIEELALQELRERPVAKSGNPRTLEQARQTVDQRLTRARNWLRKRLREEGRR